MSEQDEGMRFVGLEEKSNDKEKEITNQYRHIFLGSQMGMQVLADILDMCYFGSTLDPENKVEISRYNLGISILVRCGVFLGVTQFEVVNALAGIKKVGN